MQSMMMPVNASGQTWFDFRRSLGFGFRTPGTDTFMQNSTTNPPPGEPSFAAGANSVGNRQPLQADRADNPESRLDKSAVQHKRCQCGRLLFGGSHR